MWVSLHNSSYNINFGQSEKKITQVSSWLSQTNGNAANKQWMWIVRIKTLIYWSVYVSNVSGRTNVRTSETIYYCLLLLDVFGHSIQTSDIPIKKCYSLDYIMFAWNWIGIFRFGRHFFMWLWKQNKTKKYPVKTKHEFIIVQCLFNDHD